MTWHFLNQDSENSHCSQAQVEEYLAGFSADGNVSALLKLIPTPEACCSRVNGTDAWNGSQFGTTCEHSTGSNGGDTLTSSRADFPVRTFPAPEKVSESTGNEAGSGPSLQESLARYDPVTCSWKTVQCSLFGGLEEFSGTWPRWGMMQGGVCWELATPAEFMRVSESGSLLPTPRASMGAHGIAWCRAESGEHRYQMEDFLAHLFIRCGGQRISGAVVHPCFVEEIMMWPIAWTALEPLETDRFRQWLDSHGIHSHPDEVRQPA
jgi:hypothetical protein